MRNSKGQFIKGYGFWTGKKRPGLKSSTRFNKGESPWNEGKKCPQLTGSKNGYWKGNKIGYTGIHAWVVRRSGKATRCDVCLLDKIPHGYKRYFNWANLSGNYKRDLSDWRQMCRPCHIEYDKGRGSWGKATKLWKLNQKSIA